MISVSDASGTCAISASKAGDINYSGPVTDGPKSVTLNKATQTALSLAVPVSVTYGTTGTATTTGGSGTGAVTYSAGASSGCGVDSSTGVISVSDASGTCAITASKAGDTNYSGPVTDGPKSVTLNKATSATVVSFESGPYTYRGTAFTATAQVTGVGGLSSAVAAVYTGDCTNVTSANGCTATATFAGDTNHLGSSDTKSVTIDKATSVTALTFEASPYTYRRTAFTATAGVTGAGGLTQSVAVVYSGECTNVTSANGCTATATFAGDANHTGSSDSKSITITKATPTVVAALSSYTYDGTGHAATGQATGLGGGSDVLSPAVTLSYSGTGTTTYPASATAPSAAGTYQVIASFAGNSNYVSGDSSAVAFTISKATPAVTTALASYTYDGTAHLATGSATGVGGGSDVLSPAVTLSYSGTGTTTYPASATAPSAAGTYQVIASFAGNSNYVSGSSSAVAYTISKVHLTVTADNKAKPYDGAVFSPFTTTITGDFVSPDTAAVVSGAAAFSGPATTAVNAGNYTITPSVGTLAAANYDFTTFTDGTLTITPRPVEVTAEAKTKVYGNVDPALTFTFTPALISGDAFAGSLVRAVGENVAAYAITVGSLTAGSNYTLTYVGANFTITPATANCTVTGFSGPYTGTPHGASGHCTGVGGVDLDASLTVASTTYTDVTGGLVHWSFTNSNYTPQSGDATVAIAPAATATTLTSNYNPSLSNVEVTFTATVRRDGSAGVVPTGSIIFFDNPTGASPIQISAVTPVDAVGNATLRKIFKLTVPTQSETHNITAVFTPSTNFVTSTSAPVPQKVEPSGAIHVTFQTHSIDDDSRKPKTHSEPIVGAEVRVFTRNDVCTDDGTRPLTVTGKKKMWGAIYENCPVVTYPIDPTASKGTGSYLAKGITDAKGEVTIIVPPTGKRGDRVEYVVIGKTSMDAKCKLGDGTPCTVLSDERDDPKSPTGRCKDPTFDPDAMYSGRDPNSVISTVRPGTTTHVKLRKLRLYNGRVVPAHDIEEYGTILFVVQPDYLDWTDETAQYPIIFEAEGDWTVTTTIDPPEGFVPDTTDVTVHVVDTTDAVQVTMLDVGSDWSKTGITYTIVHKGEVRIRRVEIPMFNLQGLGGPTTPRTPEYERMKAGIVRSAALRAKFVTHVIDDNSALPKTHVENVVGAEVRVFSKADACTSGMLATRPASAWGQIFENCSVVMTGGSQAKGVTDETGAATIRVPATDGEKQGEYLVIARLSADPRCKVAVEGGAPVPCSPAGSDPEAAYSVWTPSDTAESIPAGGIVSIPLRQMRLLGESAVPARIVEAGSGVGLVAPEYVNRKTPLGRFAIVFESQNDRAVTANVSAPAGIVLDAIRLTARPTNGAAAMQFGISGAAAAGSGDDNALTLQVQEDGTQTTVSGRVRLVDQRKPPR